MRLMRACCSCQSYAGARCQCKRHRAHACASRRSGIQHPNKKSTIHKATWLGTGPCAQSIQQAGDRICMLRPCEALCALGHWDPQQPVRMSAALPLGRTIIACADRRQQSRGLQRSPGLREPAPRLAGTTCAVQAAVRWATALRPQAPVPRRRIRAQGPNSAWLPGQRAERWRPAARLRRACKARAPCPNAEWHAQHSLRMFPITGA